MGLLLPGDLAWTPATWVARAFCDDAVQNVAEAPHLADDLRFCVDAEVYTVDLRMATNEMLEELQSLVQRVLADNLEHRGTNFVQREYFPIYLQHLRSLSDLVEKALRAAE